MKSICWKLCPPIEEPMKLDGKTTEELLVLISKIETDPASAPSPGELCLYNQKASKKLTAIALQIAHNQKLKRIAAGLPVNDAGYSGRQSKRRR